MNQHTRLYLPIPLSFGPNSFQNGLQVEVVSCVERLISTVDDTVRYHQDATEPSRSRQEPAEPLIRYECSGIVDPDRHAPHRVMNSDTTVYIGFTCMSRSRGNGRFGAPSCRL
jgi:hypothetical protein